MRTRPKITSIDIIQYELILQDVAPEPTIGIPVYKPGSVMKRRRHLMAAMRNTNYYEMGLLHPKIGSTALHLYKDGYRDGIDAIDEHGCVDVPEGPGLGVEYDWDFILAHRTDGAVYK